jgi:hypothetical protein
MTPKFIFVAMPFYTLMSVLCTFKSLLIWDFAAYLLYSNGDEINGISHERDRIVFYVQIFFICLLWFPTLIKGNDNYAVSIQPTLTASLYCITLLSSQFDGEVIAIYLIWIVHVSSNRYQNKKYKRFILFAFVSSSILSRCPWLLRNWVKRSEFRAGTDSQDSLMLTINVMMCLGPLLTFSGVNEILSGLIYLMVWTYSFKTTNILDNSFDWNVIILMTATVSNFSYCINGRYYLLESTFKFVFYHFKSLTGFSFLFDPEFCDPYSPYEISRRKIFFKKGKGPQTGFDSRYRRLPTFFSNDLIEVYFDGDIKALLKSTGKVYLISEKKARQMNLSTKSCVPLMDTMVDLGFIRVGHCSTFEEMLEIEDMHLTTESEENVYFAGWNIDLTWSDLNLPLKVNRRLKNSLIGNLIIHNSKFFKELRLNELISVLNCTSPKVLRAIMGNSVSKIYSSQVNLIIKHFTNKNNNLMYSVNNKSKFNFQPEDDITFKFNCYCNRVTFESDKCELEFKESSCEIILPSHQNDADNNGDKGLNDGSKGEAVSLKPNPWFHLSGIEVSKSEEDEINIDLIDFCDEPYKFCVRGYRIGVNLSQDNSNLMEIKLKLDKFSSLRDCSEIMKFMEELEIKDNSSLCRFLKHYFFNILMSKLSWCKIETRGAIRSRLNSISNLEHKKQNSKTLKEIKKNSVEIERFERSIKEVERIESLSRNYSCYLKEEIKPSTGEEPAIISNDFLLFRKLRLEGRDKEAANSQGSSSCKGFSLDEIRSNLKNHGEKLKGRKAFKNYTNRLHVNVKFWESNHKKIMVKCAKGEGEGGSPIGLFPAEVSYNKIFYKGVRIKECFGLRNSIWKAGFRRGKNKTSRGVISKEDEAITLKFINQCEELAELRKMITGVSKKILEMIRTIKNL